MELLIESVAGGVLGCAAGRFGRAVLGGLRRGVRPPPGACEGAVAVLWACAAARGLPAWWLPAPLLLAWGGVLLACCDVMARRLPDALTLPAYPLVAVVVGVAAWSSGSARAPAAALFGAALFAGVYLLVCALAPASLGPGDVKLAGALGGIAGAVSPVAVPAAMLASSLLALAQAACARGRPVPHGPAMLVPVWLLTLAGPDPP